MYYSLKKYLFTPAVDSSTEVEQFQFGFNKIDGVNLDNFDKIFYYNIKGIKVLNKNINRVNSSNIYVDLKNVDYILYILKFIKFYCFFVFKLKLKFIKDAPTFIFYDNILKKNPGLYFKIFEFSKEDYIFEILAKKYNLPFIYNLHSIKTISDSHLQYLKSLRLNNNMLFFICPCLYHYNYLCTIFDKKKIYLSEYQGHKRVKKGLNLVFKDNKKYLILLNGNKFDSKLIKIAKQRFKGKFFIKPHPFHEFKQHSSKFLKGNNINFSGIIYNNTSSLIRLEYINIPKFFIKIKVDDKDLLEEINFTEQKLNQKQLVHIQKKYIFANFYNKSSGKNLMDFINENINCKRH